MRNDSRVWFGGIVLVTLVHALGTAITVDGVALTSRIGMWPTAAAAGAAAASLLYAARRGYGDSAGVAGTDGVAALRFFGFAALAWCAGAVIYGITGLLSASAALSLTFGDLFSLVALALFAVGFTRVAPLPTGAWSVVRHFTDAYVCAAAVFATLWLLLFAPLHAALGDSSGFMGFALLYPVADIVALCLLLPLVLRSPHGTRRVVLIAMGAFTIICGADLLSTITRLTGEPLAGGIEYPVRGLGFALLIGLPWLTRDRAEVAPRRITGHGLYRFASEFTAVAAVAVATLVLTVAGLRADGIALVLPLAAGSAVLVLLVRLLGLLEENVALTRMIATRERHFHTLARNSGDAVLTLDEHGCIDYLNPGAAEAYGYRSDELLAQPVTTLLHPEDLPRVTAAASTFRRGAGDGVHMRVRVRAADGTWRHTDATASLYERRGDAPRVLVTARDVSAQVELEQQVTHLTFHDGITGFPNRAYLEERTHEVLSHRRAQEARGDVAVIFLDLDGFTSVNDSAGHTFGDYLLAQAARRLRATVGVRNTVARWGGDEFAVLVEHVDEAQRVVDLANRMVRGIAGEPFSVADRQVVLSASVGVAFAEDGTDSGELLRNADMAMVRAKEEGGGGRVEIYAAHMHAQVMRRLELQTQLRQAFADGAFTLEYQPIVELESSRVAGVEALVRWCHEETLLPPEDFLAPAEESGLIVPLGEWILGEACRDAVRWRASGWDIGISVNLSAKQILAPDFVEMVSRTISENGLPGSALTLEVGEEVLLDDSGAAVARLALLRDLGVRFAIDDFGMGYASLAYLRQLHVDALKIDPSFIRDLDSDETVTLLTQTIVRLGRDLGMLVVAEGVERVEQWESLRRMGCALGQGFLVARPMSAEKLTLYADETVTH